MSARDVIADALRKAADKFDDPVSLYVEPEAKRRWERNNPSADWYPDAPAELRDDDLSSWRIFADELISALPAGYRIVGPGEVPEAIEAVEFVARWAWRSDPPGSTHVTTDAERLSVIKHYPTIKDYGNPHIELAEQEAADIRATVKP